MAPARFGQLIEGKTSKMWLVVRGISEGKSDRWPEENGATKSPITNSFHWTLPSKDLFHKSSPYIPLPLLNRPLELELNCPAVYFHNVAFRLPDQEEKERTVRNIFSFYLASPFIIVCSFSLIY
jgi:hypothetical protein